MTIEIEIRPWDPDEVEEWLQKLPVSAESDLGSGAPELFAGSPRGCAEMIHLVYDFFGEEYRRRFRHFGYQLRLLFELEAEKENLSFRIFSEYPRLELKTFPGPFDDKPLLGIRTPFWHLKTIVRRSAGGYSWTCHSYSDLNSSLDSFSLLLTRNRITSVGGVIDSPSVGFMQGAVDDELQSGTTWK